MSRKSNLTVVILTKNEEKNLPDCLSSIGGLNADTFIVDSGSTDNTVQLARDAGCQVFEHPFENYSKQRNWAFDNLPIVTQWILCLDADERLLPPLTAEINSVVNDPTCPYMGYILRKRTIFLGKWIRFGGQYPNCHLNLFKQGRVRCEARLYDQHYVVDGPVSSLKSDYEDVITSNVTTWIERHNQWATAEALEVLSNEGNHNAPTSKQQVRPSLFGNRIERLRFLRKKVYQRFPLFVRPMLLWIYSYIFRLGFLDGKEGLIFFTLQRFWFRFLVDCKIYEIRKSRSLNTESDSSQKAA